MPPVDRVGRYKGVIQDWAVSRTNKNKLPQFVCTLFATEKLSDDNETWEDWAPYEQTITAFNVLMTVKNNAPVRCLSYDQTVAALGWDGVGFASLAAGDWTGKAIQFTVKSDSYTKDSGETETKLKVTWIDNVEASTGLASLSAEDVAAMDVEFGIVSMKGTPATAKKSKAKAKVKATPPVTPPVIPPVTPPVTPTVAPTVAPTPAAAAAPPGIPVGPCTEADGYATCLSINAAIEPENKRLPQETIDEYWLTIREKVAANPMEVTEEEWEQIRDKVLEHITIPF